MRAVPPAVRPAGRATFLRHWLPVLVYMGFILSLSSVQTPGPTFFTVQDKLLHFRVYAGLGAVPSRAFRAAFEGRAGLPWPVGAALAGSAYGVLDELYQLTVPGRTSDVRDWIADTLGALAAVLVLRLAWGIAASQRSGGPRPGGGEATPTGVAR